VPPARGDHDLDPHYDVVDHHAVDHDFDHHADDHEHVDHHYLDPDDFQHRNHGDEPGYFI
jgi:hypothetical protein